jgi:uncharacterized protein YfdQ (DUF2303 family)
VCSELAARLLYSAGGMLQSLSWLDQSTMTAALTKLFDMAVNVADDPSWGDYPMLVLPNSTSNFLNMYSVAAQYMSEMSLVQWGNPPNRYQFPIDLNTDYMS